MATLAHDNVDYRLLNKLSNLVICSHCLRPGKVTPIPQVISKHHKPNNVCRSCRQNRSSKLRGALAKVLQFQSR